ncbi:phospholipase ABHD3-like [Rhipicephalus sanguineus]|uniref:phospholipase ABHD3-like n=1 Tax=Rhipicephalus sanguineus TaxID=34632 RepID=UPI001895D6A3|nr:phospholipase ABHD3-like [Rhipicephalus sanguineus]
MKLSTQGELLVCVSCAVYVVYYILVVVRKPRLVCRAGRLRRFLSGGMDEFIRNYYWAPIWCFGANMQCLVGFLYNSWLPRLSYRRELLELSDRGLVALDWVNEDQTGPVVILAGGGFTDSQSRPWRALLPALTALGNPCVVVNGRGCGGVPLTTNRITYAASVSDFAEVVAEVRKRYPTECVLGVGVSLGGLQLALYLCQWGPRAQLDAAVAVSAPFQLGLASRNLGRWGTNMLLNVWMTRRFVRCLRDNEEVVRTAKVVEADKVFSCWTLSSFNKRYAAPVYGFPSLEDFYEHCSLKVVTQKSREHRYITSSGRALARTCRDGWAWCSVPLVFLFSSDDALNPRSASLEEEIMKSPWLAAVVTPRGGHMGFVDGWLWPRQPFYLERFVTSFVQGVHRVCKSRGVQVLHNLGE